MSTNETPKRLHTELHADVSVTFRRHPPDEEVLHFVRRCARKLGSDHARTLHVIVERLQGDSLVHLFAGNRRQHLLSESDADVFLAVRNAFGRLGADEAFLQASDESGVRTRLAWGPDPRRARDSAPFLASAAGDEG